MSLALIALSPSDFVVTGPSTLCAWREKHQLPVPGHEYMPRFKKHQWDGMWTPGKWCRQRADNTFELRCSRGLVPRIVRDVGGVEFNFQAASEDDIAEFYTSTPQVARLRDYQRHALDTVLRAGWGRVAYATNAGKGAVIALLARFCQRRGEPVLICCDEVAVFDALQGELATWGDLRPGLVQRGVQRPDVALVTLAMVPTLARRLAAERKAPLKPWTTWLAQMKMLLLDEADKAIATTWRSILAGAPNTTWRAGFSGSFPGDLYQDLKLDELMGPIAARISNAEMVARGVSAKPSIEVHAFEGTSSLRAFPSDWWRLPAPERRTLVYDKVIGTNQARHNFVAALVRPDTLTTVVVNRIEHGRALALTIPGAVFLDGATSERERLAALEAFRDGTVRVLVVTKILDRGTNRLGYTADLIFASGEGSTTQTLQRIGRGLRRADGKEYLRLVDVIDRIEVGENAPKSLKMAAAFLHAAARKRLAVYVAQGFDIEVVQ